MGVPPLRAPTFAESVAIDNYKGAVTGALASADSVSDKIVTAAFSVATAFGAIVALVTPKDSTSSYLIALPFILLAGAVGAALYAESLAVPINLSDDLATVKTSVDTTISSKRLAGRVALVALALGMLGAGLVLASTYRSSSKSTSTTVSLWLTAAGDRAVKLACGNGFVSPLRGTVSDPSKLSGATISIKVEKSSCANGTATIVLPAKAVSLAKH